MDSNPTLADDTSCITSTPVAIQNILTTAYKYSTNWRFKFNSDKSSVLRFSSSSIRNQSNLSWLLRNESVVLSKSYNHLGILLQSKLVHKEKIENGCRKGRQSYFGIKILDHFKSDPLSRLYKKVVLPSILYGCELWCDLRQRSPSTRHAPTLHMQKRHGSSKNNKIRHLWISLRTLAHIIRNWWKKTSHFWSIMWSRH